MATTSDESWISLEIRREAPSPLSFASPACCAAGGWGRAGLSKKQEIARVARARFTSRYMERIWFGELADHTVLRTAATSVARGERIRLTPNRVRYEAPTAAALAAVGDTFLQQECVGRLNMVDARCV